MQPVRLFLITAAAALVLTAGVIAQRPAPAGTGTLSGTVTADSGEVRALRVKARNTSTRVAYTVFTVKGRYQILNLPAGPYDVQVVEEAFESPVQQVQLGDRQTQTANIAVKMKAAFARGAGNAGSIAQTSYGATPQDKADLSQVELVDFDALYPPSPARDLMVQHCFPCHGVSGWHGRRLNEVGWRRVVNRMFAKDGRVANMAVGVPQVPYTRVSEQQKEEIIKYLTATFGPGSKARDLKTDSLVRDEQALSTALYVQYELKRSVADRKFANGLAPVLGGHSAFASLANPGVVYISGNSSNSILRVDTRDPNYDTRTKEFWIDNPGNVNATPHGIVEVNGKIWFTELAGDRISTLDPNTGQFQRYRIPTEGGGPHSLWNDSKGNFWFTYFAAAGKIGRFDSKTQQVREYDFPDFSGYGLVVDKQDRAWAVGLNTPVVYGYDPSTDKWSTYKLTSPARRVAIDSKGMVWACEYFGNRIARIDPASGKVTEYDLPLKWGNPYDLWPDAEDNIWVENAVYNSLVKFDPRTTQWTYVPFPDLGAHTPKLDRDKEGTLWFTLGASPKGLAAFKPKGNVPSGSAPTAAQ
jgi:virginiamycin B lyase